ncbi:MAG: acetolactate synthase large subunit, partial [Actinobacteria bacterium]
MKMTGAEIAIKCLEKQGVTVMFGYPGGQIMPFYDKLLDSKKINHILVRHEQAAAHAADAYSRATGKVGVCVATSGPGATNLVTGIANAYMDSIPIVAITGQVPTPVIGTDAFQEADITGITLPIVKHSFLVKDIKDLPEAISESFYIAGSGRPGPVLIDLPRDVQIAEMEYRCPEHVTLSGYKPTTRGHAKQIKQAVRAIMAAERPVIYAGGGVVLSDSALELSKLVGLTKIPVTTTLMGKGAYNESEQLSLGILGMHGTRYANYAITNSDLLI